jgi:hypothetical protein
LTGKKEILPRYDRTARQVMIPMRAKASNMSWRKNPTAPGKRTKYFSDCPPMTISRKWKYRAQRRRRRWYLSFG